MSPDVPTVKVSVLTGLNWSKWLLVIDIFTHILLNLLTFIALQILQKVSLCCAMLLFGVLLHKRQIYT